MPQQTDNTVSAFDNCGLDPSVLPPLMRRRTSLATRMAITAADRACNDAGTGRDLPAIFVSTLGEMQVTHRLCEAIARQVYPLSPTLFHNSVHNTAASYWSIAVNTMEPMQAMAGLDDGFALGLTEAACQLATDTTQLLLVCYDEHMPAELLPDATWPPCSVALVLGSAHSDRPQLSIPWQEAAAEPATAPACAIHNPALQALPLLELLRSGATGTHCIQLAPGSLPWFANLVLP